MTTPQPRRWPPPQLASILYGGDYNPEQWTPAMGYEGEQIWLEDMRLMRAAGVNVVTVGVFSWVALQPDQQTFTFDWLDRIMELLSEHGIYACLATATAAQPAWLSAAQPEILPTNEAGLRRRHGERMNFCPTSAAFRSSAGELVRALAKRYGKHPALLLWHISNEYGPSCYCESCAARFRTWLQERYGSLEELNRRWVTPFWGHSFTDWAQIEPPGQLGERSMQGLTLDYQRFISDMNRECYQAELAILREATPLVPVTTNFHGLVKHLDYFSWAPHLDVIAWDSYPPRGEHPAATAFRLDLMRGLRGGQPWILMEQAPSQVQWRPYNPLKRPGEMRLQSYQAVAHGADGVMFFQWRQSRGAAEMHHSAVVSHAGHEHTRVFREVAELGAELSALGDTLLGARTPARVALMWSWPNWWAVEYRPGLSSALSYLDEATRYYSAVWQHQVAVDIISPDSPLDGYDLVIAPLLYLITEEQAAALERYVEAGGTLVTSYFSGIVGEDARAWLGGSPGPLRRTLGIWVEEVDPLLPGQQNSIVVPAGEALPFGAYDCDLWCEVVHLEGARALAQFGQDFYAGQPAITSHQLGAGRALYIATRPDAGMLGALLGTLLGELGIGAPLDAPEGVEVMQRQIGNQSFIFLLNHHADAREVRLPQTMRDLLTGQQHTGSIELGPRGVAILANP